MRLPPLPSLREILQLYNLRATKDLSQNFLLDKRITDKIALGIPPHARLVLEVGCGPGCLTRSILEKCTEMSKLVGVEKDERFQPALQMLGQAVNFQEVDETGHRVDHRTGLEGVDLQHESSALDDHIAFQLLQGDILRVNELKLLQRFEESYRREDGAEAHPGDIVFTGNLPFGIATPLLIKWLKLLSRSWGAATQENQTEQDLRSVCMLLMFQKEVAERIASKPGKKTYGRLSILAQNWFKPRILFNVKGGSFVPPPKVDASVILMMPRSEGPLVPGISFDELENFVQLVFKGRRKRATATMKQDLMIRLAGDSHNESKHNTIDREMGSGEGKGEKEERKGSGHRVLLSQQADKLMIDLFREAFPNASGTHLETLLHRRAQEFNVEEMCTLAKTYQQSQLLNGLERAPTGYPAEKNEMKG